MNFMNENPKRALLVVDVQNEYFTGKLPITYPAGSLTNVLSAMDAARARQTSGASSTSPPSSTLRHSSPARVR
jgi:nicotinamidase-related amidase